VDAGNTRLDGTLDVTNNATVGGTLAVNGNVTMGDAKNIILNTNTGTQIGTAADQKLGFFGKTPVIQEDSINDADGDLANVKEQLNKVIASLKALGLIAD